MERDITDLIERIETFEERAGVRFEALNGDVIEIDDGLFISIRGELHSSAGEEIERSVDIVVGVYDESSRLVGTHSRWIDAAEFFGFDTFEVCIKTHVDAIARVRVYPKVS